MLHSRSCILIGIAISFSPFALFYRVEKKYYSNDKEFSITVR